MPENLIVVTVLGKDRPGVLAGITKVLADANVNIVDIEQIVIRRLLSLFLLVDLSTSKLSYSDVRDSLLRKGDALSVQTTVAPAEEYITNTKESEEKKTYAITVLGVDRPGIVANISGELAGMKVNIEQIKMISRGALLAMGMLVDIPQEADLNDVKLRLGHVCEKLSMDFIIQPEDVYRQKKKLVVFDMDSTIIDAEVIDELAKVVGVGDKAAEITAKGLRGEIDFEEGVRQRVKLLSGTPIKVLDDIAENIKLTPGSEELIKALKEMDFKIALISGGFTYFTDRIKERFGFDYAFGNDLVIKEGRLTGEIRGKIIDRVRKGELLDDLLQKEGLAREEIVAIGDGASNQIMLNNAGLGIAFNTKEVLKQVADGVITKNNLKGLLYCLGVENKNKTTFS